MGVRLHAGDALLLVDVQADFVDGALAVRGAAQIIPVLNEYVLEFAARHLPVIASRDWHPHDHVSFRESGGPWPAHCVAGTIGAAFATDLQLPDDVRIVSKATRRERDAYSAFDETPLAAMLRELHVSRLFVGGLATDHCVLATVLDARQRGFPVFLLVDAIRAVDLAPGDGERAIRRMVEAGAQAFTRARIESCEGSNA